MKIYYRPSLMADDELKAANKYFDCVPYLSDIKEKDYIIPRYSLYPFISDQLKEIKSRGASCITDINQHLYIADLKNYYQDLKGLTPKTWDRLQDIPEEGLFVLKGETNSRKSDWNRSMFAKDKQAANKVYSELSSDSLIGAQTIYIREYVPLIKFFDGIGGIPITKEFRFFIAFGEVLCGAYYWQNYAEEMKQVPDSKEVPQEFLNKVIDKVGSKSNFYVIDVAQTQSGKWIVIELNAGVASGLSCNDPEILYKRLHEVCLKNGD